MDYVPSDRVRRVVSVFGVSLLIAFAAWSVFVVASGGERLATGSFGDAFGAANSLAAALTACLALWSLKLQRQELSQTREEIAVQRQEQMLQNRLLGAQMAAQLALSQHVHQAHDYKVSVGKVVLGSAHEHQKNRQDAMKRYMGFLREQCRELKELSDELSNIEKQLAAPSPHRQTSRPETANVGPSRVTVPTAVFAAVSIVVLWGLMVCRVGLHPVGTGLFGDAFGPLTGLATVLAVLISLSAISVQHEELHLTREEMSGQTFELQVHNLLTVAHLRAQVESHVGAIQSEVVDIGVHPSKDHFSDDERRSLFLFLWEALADLSKTSRQRLTATIVSLHIMQSEPVRSGESEGPSATSTSSR